MFYREGVDAFIENVTNIQVKNVGMLNAGCTDSEDCDLMDYLRCAYLTSVREFILRYMVSTALLLKIGVFHDVTPFRLLGVNQRFGRDCNFHLLGRPLMSDCPWNYQWPLFGLASESNLINVAVSI